jgi:hypothetical protein
MTNKKIVYKPIDPEIEELARHHGGKREATLEVLKDLSTGNKLNSTTLIDTARSLHIPAHEAYGMATFYSISLHCSRTLMASGKKGCRYLNRCVRRSPSSLECLHDFATIACFR